MAKSGSENLAIMFTDIVGFTERTSHQSRAENQAMLDDFERIVRPLITNFSGRLIKMIGDACLATFHSPTDAVRCGMAMQDAVAERNQDKPPEQQVHIRVAINAGEVRLSGKDIFGEAVNVASRVEGIAPADEIYLTEAVYLAMNKAEVASESVGTHTLKGIPEPVKVYRVPPGRVVRLVASEETEAPKHGELPYGGMHRVAPVRPPSRVSPKLVAAIAAVVILGGGIAGWALLRPPPPNPLLAKAEEALAAKRWDEVSEMAAKALAENPKSAAAVMLRGHVAAGRGRYGEALTAYSQALALEPGLRNDQRFAANLVSGLGRVTAAVEMIRKYPVDPVVAGLKKRASEPGYGTRHQAQALLKQLGQTKGVDFVAGAILDLKEGESCEQRLEGVRTMAQANDKRALPPLKKLLDGNLFDRLRENCLWSEAEAVVAKLEGKKK
jgi:class 3 adenylate cyclase